MDAKQAPSMRVCSLASTFSELTAREKKDFFAIVAASSNLMLTVEDIERTIASAGDISRAAVALGCSRRTLQLHMRQLGIAPGRGGRRKRLEAV